jgi:hypothetical protein
MSTGYWLTRDVTLTSFEARSLLIRLHLGNEVVAIFWPELPDISLTADFVDNKEIATFEKPLDDICTVITVRNCA